ncbi:hypothetical protein [Methylobacterium sp. SI9]|uniref:hypothetical protein n=1 Tax=Methylobacterium guangdongense TaxID=3138811 RepID=UPI00313C5C0A
MSSSPLAILSPATRSLEWLVGPGALLSSTALSTGQLASLGPIASQIEGAVSATAGSDGGSVLPDTLAETANTIVLDTHAQLETVGHEVAPLNGPLHGLTNLGETIGLGHIGEAGNLITDLTGAVTDPNAGTVAPLLTDAGHVTDAANTLLDTVAAVPAAGNGLVGTGSVLTPATDILNQTVLDLHTTLEDIGHSVPQLNEPIHAVTGLGETVGLGHIGEPGNLLTDALAVPGSVLNGGGLASADPLLSDLGHVLGATDTLLGSATGALSGGSLLASDGLLAPVTNLANMAVLDVHMTLENLGHEIPLLNDAIHGLTNLGETVGLGHLGEGGNLLTDVAGLPGDLLGGQGLGAVSPILGDVGAVTNAAGGLVDGVTGLVGTLGSSGAGIPAAGGLLTPVTATVDGLLGDHAASPLAGLLGGVTGDGQSVTGSLLGAGAPLQPVGDVANTLIDTVHAGLEQVGHDVPVLNDPLHSVITLGNMSGLGELGETSNLVTDVVNLPGSVLTGNGVPATGQVVSDVGHVADAAGGVLDSATGLLSGGGAGSGASLGDLLTPVTTAVGTVTSGAAGNEVGTLLGGLTGGTTGEAGAHPLIDVSAGPTTTAPVADAAILTPAADPAHTVEVSAVSVGADQPSLATANLLTGDSILLPQTGGGGADALVGQLASAIQGTTATPADAEASHGASVDLGIATVDLGGHADVQHTDPTPHTTTSGLHLLGL